MNKQILLVVGLLCLFGFKKKEIIWTAIGDSITYLNDHVDETGNRVTKGYMTRVTDQLPNVHYANQGHNGWSAARIAEWIDSLGIQKADVYSIFLGTNDWWQGHPLGTMQDYVNGTGTGTTCGAFRIIIDKIRSLNQRAKIVLISPMQRADFVYIADSHNHAFGSDQPKNGQRLEDFAWAVVAIGKHEHVPVIDLYHAKRMSLSDMVNFKRLKDPITGTYRDYKYPAWKNIPFNPDTDVYPYPEAASDVTFDGLHPSDKGDEMIAKKLIRIFKKM